MTASNLVETARSYLGVTEGSAAHRAIVDRYNTIQPLPRGYRVTYTDAWCAVFVAFCALISGTVLPLECGCQEMYAAFPVKKSRTATPGIGWAIFYDWNQDGHTEHVGIVESVKGGVITAIEGNHNDRVGRRQIRVGDPTIYGYGVPEFKEDKKVSNAQTIWDYLYKWIGNAFGAAGLMGNLRAESELRPTNMQDRFEQGLGLSDAQYTSKVDDGSYANFVYDSAGYGLAQWTFWSRKKALLEYARSRKVSIGDLYMQLDFLQKEMVENYPALVTSLQQAKTVREASDAVLFIYESPADQGQKVQDLRASYGEAYYKEYAGKERKVIVTRTAFLSGIIKTAQEAHANGWTWGDSHTWPPSLDGLISCDRLVSRTLARDFGIEQKRGGWNSAELAQNLTRFGFTKITDRKKIKPGAVVMIGKGADQTYHTMVVERYDPSTDRCDKVDLGHDDRIKVGGRFKNVPLVEWDDRFFSMAFNPADDPAPEKSKKDIIKAGQEHSAKFTGHSIKIDGDRGKETRAQAFRVLRHALNLDYFGGEMGEDKGDTKLLEVALGTHYVKRGEKQHMVTAAEILLELQGIDPHGVEFPGQFGPGLEAAAGKSRIEAADFLKWCRA